MGNRFDTTTHHAASTELTPLLHCIWQHWAGLLAHKRLDVELHQLDGSARVRCEIFVGDEFIYAGKRCVDVVIKPHADDAVDALPPSVLVFEMQNAVLMQHELNGIQLDTLVMVGAVPEQRKQLTQLAVGAE